jgi:hypothetical protein
LVTSLKRCSRTQDRLFAIRQVWLVQKRTMFGSWCWFCAVILGFDCCDVQTGDKNGSYIPDLLLPFTHTSYPASCITFSSRPCKHSLADSFSSFQISHFPSSDSFLPLVMNKAHPSDPRDSYIYNNGCAQFVMQLLVLGTLGPYDVGCIRESCDNICPVPSHRLVRYTQPGLWPMLSRPRPVLSMTGYSMSCERDESWGEILGG